MAKAMKTRKGKDNIYYPYTSPDIVVDSTGESQTTKNTNMKTDIDSIKTDLGTEELTTNAKDVKGAVNEVVAQYKDIANKIKDLKQGLDLSNLTLSTESITDGTKLIMTDGVTTKSTVIPGVSETTVESIIQKKIDDGSLSEIQAVIEDGSITTEKLAFYSAKRINLLDASAVTSGEYVNANNGNVAKDDYLLTDYMLIDPTKTYKLTNASMPAGWMFAFYDADKKFVANGATNNYNTIPKSAKYLRITLYSSTDLSTAMFTEESVDTTNYIPYDELSSSVDENFAKTINEKGIDMVVNSGQLKNNLVKTIPTIVEDLFSNDKIKGIITPNSTNFFVTTRINYADGNNLLPGVVWEDSGVYQQLGNYKCTDFIETTNGDIWITNASSCQKICLYDENKTFIKNSGSPNTATIDDNSIKYIRFNFPSNTTEYIINKGDTLLPYVPYEQQNLAFTKDYYKDSFVEYLLNSEKGQTIITNIINGISIEAKPLRGLKLGILGDSITNWGKYGTYIAENEECEFINYGIAGTKIADPNSDDTGSMCYRYAKMQDDLDIILLFGGTNDLSTDEAIGTMEDRVTTTLYGACHITIKGILEKYPGKMIGVILPIQRDDASMEGLKKKVEVVREVAHYYSVPVLDMFNEGGITCRSQVYIDNFITDQLHPNDEGNKILARRIASFIKTL